MILLNFSNVYPFEERIDLLIAFGSVTFGVLLALWIVKGENK